MNKKRFYYILLVILSCFLITNVKAFELELDGLQRNQPTQKGIGLTPVIKYQAHVSGIGWQNYVDTGEVAGTTGQGRALEALKINVENLGGTLEVLNIKHTFQG